MKDYYQILGVEKGNAGRYKKGLPQAGPQVPPRPESRRQGLRAEIQGDQRGPRNPEGPGKKEAIRPSVRWGPGNARGRPAAAAAISRASISAPAATALSATSSRPFSATWASRAPQAGRRTKRAERGEDLHYSMNLNFMDAANGIETPIQISHKQACPTCRARASIRSPSRAPAPPAAARAACRNRPGS